MTRYQQCDRTKHRWKEECFDTVLQYSPNELEIPSTNILLMSLSTTEDCFIVDVTGLLEVLSKMKNHALLHACYWKTFDPLVMFTPSKTRIKCSFQDMWLIKIPWDKNLPASRC